MVSKKMKFDKQYDVVVIGAGLGGLVCGALLAKKGKSVKVFEQGQIPGGCCVSFKRKGFTFDACVHYLTGCGPGGVIYFVLQMLSLENDIEFYRLSPHYKCILPGDSFEVSDDAEEYIQMLSTKFPHEKENIRPLFQTMTEAFTGLMTLPSYSPALLKYNSMVFQQVLDQHLKDNRLKGILSSLWPCAGLPPSRTSAAELSAIVAGCALSGNYYPKGGVQTIPNALAKALSRFGGQLELNTKVTRILMQKGKAVGIETESRERIGASVVVSNIAARQLFTQLMNPRELELGFVAKLGKREFCISDFLVYLGVDLDPRDYGITCHEVILRSTYDADAEYKAILQGNLTSYLMLTCPTVCADPDLAPKGQHCLVITALAPYHLRNVDWKRDKKRVAEEIIKKVEQQIVPDLSKHIVVMDSASPLTIERYTLNSEGAMLGWANLPENILQNSLQLKTSVENLYLAGQWTIPGGGTLAAMLSGFLAAETIALS